MVDLIPATKVYRDYGLPRSMMRDLVRGGLVRMEVRLSPDGVNQMFLYSKSDLERYLSTSTDFATPSGSGEARLIGSSTSTPSGSGAARPIVSTPSGSGEARSIGS